MLEMLVVLAIMAAFLAFLLPAILQVREVSNRAQCANNLKHIGLAMLNHHTLYRRFPSGGWGWLWVGDPDRFNNHTQPGGWVYNILPFLDQSQLHQRGAGGTWAQKREAAAQLVQTPQPLLNCPSRRPAVLYPNTAIYFNANPVTEVARSDYAACAGDLPIVENGIGPNDFWEGDGPTFWSQPAYATDSYHGVIFQRSTITMADLAHGASTTYLIGEKYLNPNDYATGADGADNENVYVAMDNDLSRSTCAPPVHDQAGYANGVLFGSAHPAGANMLFCDGSFRFVSYAVDPEVHRMAGSRQ
jgi:prepilin-type processing-associated H-X9-DG protein